MALVGNGVRLASTSPCRTASGVGSIYAANVSGAITPGSRRCWWDGPATGLAASLGAIPYGQQQPGAWALAPVSGGIAMRNEVYLEATLAAAAEAGLGMDVATSSAVTMTATADLIAGLELALALALTLTADVAGSVSGEAALTAALTASAEPSALGFLAAELAAAVTAEGTPHGIGFMSATITSYTELSVEGLRDALWNSLATAYNTAGTMGELLNAAGSGGLASEFQTILRELSVLAGLDPTKPLVVTATSRTAGDIEQTIADTGTATTVTRT